jgi:hypothetical protein
MTKFPNPNKIPMTNTHARANMSSVICSGNLMFFWDLVIGTWNILGIWHLGHWDLQHGDTAETVTHPVRISRTVPL